MNKRGTVVWAPDPFKTNENGSNQSNPQPWLLVATDRLPYPDEECIAVALTTQTHHPGSFPVSRDDWIRGKPRGTSYVLPWSLATLKHDLHVVGQQGALTATFADRVVSEIVSYFESPAG